jgi:hypothetical protein
VPDERSQLEEGGRTGDALGVADDDLGVRRQVLRVRDDLHDPLVELGHRLVAEVQQVQEVDRLQADVGLGDRPLVRSAGPVGPGDHGPDAGRGREQPGQELVDRRLGRRPRGHRHAGDR